jgi:putative ABC transport system ATP-binding protein
LENVLLGMSFGGGKVDRTRALELLDRVGLSKRASHRPGQLSVGEQQRVAVARALANRPSLLLADEPTASVDIANQETILTLIREACTADNVSLLLVTHSPDIASRFNRIARLDEINRVSQAATAAGGPT